MNQNKYLYKKRLKVLKFAKNIISEEGINHNTIKNISNRYGLNFDEMKLLFPDGKNDLITFILDQLNIELEDYCKKMDLIRLPIHKRVRKVLLAKISLMNKEKIFYKKIFLNLLISKKNITFPLKLYKSVDQIWFIVGDSSVDFNFYTKRFILSVIYSRVILFFFNNNDQEALESLLDQNLKRVSKIPELKSKLNFFIENFPKILNFVKTHN